jgi:arylsulfatase A-like enzyme
MRPTPSAPSTAVRVDDPRPNIVVVMTDDQSVADLEAMPRVQRLLGAAGVSFDRSYVS